MSNTMKNKERWYFAAVLIACVPQAAGVISILRNAFLHLFIRPDTISFIVKFLVLMVVLLLVKNSHWRYGFACTLVSASLLFVSRILYEGSITAAAILCLISILPLIPALFFFNKFRNDENIQIYGKEYVGSYLKILAIVAALLLLIIMIFYLGGLVGTLRDAH